MKNVIAYYYNLYISNISHTKSDYYFESDSFLKCIQQFITGMKVFRVKPTDILNIDISPTPLNKYTKNIILKTLPITDPSLWKLVPNDTVVSAISEDTPIFLVHSILTGIEAADEQVASEVSVDGIIFFQNFFTPTIPALI